MICPICRNENIEVKTFQEQAGSTQFQHTTSKYKEKGHGVVWWRWPHSWPRSTGAAEKRRNVWPRGTAGTEKGKHYEGLEIAAAGHCVAAVRHLRCPAVGAERDSHLPQRRI